MASIPNVSATAPMSAIGVSFPSMRRFSVDEYHRMIESGILGENDRVELLDGWIVEMSPIGPPHAWCVSVVVSLLHERLPTGWVVRAQSPITTLTSEPEPDIVVAKGSFNEYRERHPGGDDIGIVVEVADASLSVDRKQKRELYALAKVAEYWILNLVNRQLEVHRRPENGNYLDVEVLRSGESITCTEPTLASVSISVAEILP